MEVPGVILGSFQWLQPLPGHYRKGHNVTSFVTLTQASRGCVGGLRNESGRVPTHFLALSELQVRQDASAARTPAMTGSHSPGERCLKSRTEGYHGSVSPLAR